ncbi:DUF4153 domain-containing protein [Candidatus Peregrinibacteria bacterium]|nr:MAG: DUF4153 domain-containing protein [Candidatus Peregrinibacteria bacterium]
MAFLPTPNFSLSHLASTVARFPLALLSSALCTGLLIGASRMNPYPENVDQALSSLFIGILLFGGLALLAERLRLRSWLIQLMGIPLLYLLVYSVEPSGYWVDLDMLHLGMIFVASLALVFVGPYVRNNKEEQGFWNYSIATLSSALIAIATALILWLGFSLAIFSIQELFNVTMSYTWTQDFGYFFCILLASLVFYMGIPTDYKDLQKQAPAEKMMRSFVLYISFPLLLTYFLILSVYVVKILATQDWPEGFVAMPVLLFTLLGYGTYALLFLLRNEKVNKLIGRFLQVFPWTTIPFLLVYFVAFWKRIEPYGLTEERYLGVLLGLVLLGWSLYYATQKKASLRWIPLSVVIVGLLCSVGPWSPRALSEWSQMSRLESVLTRTGILVEGEIVPLAENTLSDEDGDEIFSKVEYLVNHHDGDAFSAWFGEGAKGMSSEDVLRKMGLEHYDPYEGPTDYFDFGTDGDEVLTAAGYDYALQYIGYVGSFNGLYELPNGAGTLTIDLLEYSQIMQFEFNDQVYEVPLTDLMTRLEAEGRVDSLLPREDLSLTFEEGRFKVKIYFNSINWSRMDDVLQSTAVDCEVFLSVK